MFVCTCTTFKRIRSVRLSLSLFYLHVYRISFDFRTWPRRLARSTGYSPDEIAYGVTKVAAHCLRALSSNEEQEEIHRDLMHKYAKGPAKQLTKYEQKLMDLIQPALDEKE